MEISASADMKWKGKVAITAWDKNDKIVKKDILDNLVVDTGIDSVLKTLGRVANNTSLGVSAIGVGSSTTGEGASQTGLQGTNIFKKDITLEERIYARPTLFVSIAVGYAEANFVWSEIGLFDTVGIMIARVVDQSPLPKTDTIRGLLEWRITI